MDAKDIITLLNAGYTKEEINGMEMAHAQETPTPTPTPTPVPVPAPVVNGNPDPYPAPVDLAVTPPVVVPTPTPAPVPQPTPEPVPETSMHDVLQAIAKLTSAVQANGIASSVMPPNAMPNAPKAEDMLAEIIRPSYKERG